MNKFERQSRHPAEPQTLPEAIASDLSHLPAGVIDISDAPPIAPKAPLTQGEVRTILMSLMLTMFLAALDQTIVATALPTIGRQFQDVSNLSWVITAYLLAATAVAPVFGTLSDIYGRRAMIIAALSMFIAGSVRCALAPNMPVLILARGLQGLGGGGIMPVVQTVISDVVTPRERGQYQAYFSGVWVAAGIGGPVLGGVFAEHLHWSMIFWINVPLALAALALLLPKMAKIPVFHRKRKVDWLGGVLLMASAVVFMLVLTWGGNRYLWLSPTILAMTGASVALACSFVWYARKADEPFLPLPLWGLLVLLSIFSLGLGTTFPISVVSLQNSVARAQIGTVTGAMNFFRSLMSSFTVAAFTAILLTALGADISLVGEHRGPVNSIPVADMITAFRYVFGAAAALLACATLCMIAMEERPLAGPGTAPPEMAE